MFYGFFRHNDAEFRRKTNQSTNMIYTLTISITMEEEENTVLLMTVNHSTAYVTAQFNGNVNDNHPYQLTAALFSLLFIVKIKMLLGNG